MAITRLKRKARRNKLTSKLRNQKLALESARPVLKNIDIEAVKAEFKVASAKVKKEIPKEESKAEPKAEKPAKKEVTVEKPAKKEAAPAAEKKAPAKKVAPKKDKKKD